MKDIPAIIQSHIAKRIALYGSQPKQPLTEELFKRYSELQSTNDKAFLGSSILSAPSAVTTNATASSTAYKLECG